MSSVPRNKDELELAIKSIFPKLMADYRSIPESKARKSGVEGNIKGTIISVSDTVAYLIGWGKLVLKWYRLKSQNQHVDFPETGYKWNQLGLLAESFHEEYRDWKYDDLLVELESTVNEILLLISSLSDYELYGVAWYEQWTLGRMIQFNTSSPMKNMRYKSSVLQSTIHITRRLRVILNAWHFRFVSALVFTAQWFRLDGGVVHTLTRR